MVADIEVIANHGNKSKSIPEYFELMADLFLELWMGFSSTLERGLRIIDLTSSEKNDRLPYKHQINQITLRGTFGTVQDPDVLPNVNSGYEVQQYQAPEEITGRHWIDPAVKRLAQCIFAEVRS